MKKIRCRLCHKWLDRVCSHQKYCGNQKLKGSCSWKNNRVLSLESHRRRRRFWACEMPDYPHHSKKLRKRLKRGVKMLIKYL